MMGFVDLAWHNYIGHDYKGHDYTQVQHDGLRRLPDDHAQARRRPGHPRVRYL